MTRTDPGSAPRWSFRRLRQASLALVFLVVLGWGFLNWRADNFTFAWDRPVNVLVVAVLDPEADAQADLLRGFLGRFLGTGAPLEINLAGVARWFELEHRRHTGRPLAPVVFSSRGPVQVSAPPPLPPTAGEPYLQRFLKTREFLGYFRELGDRERLVLEGYDAVIFVYFFDEERTAAYAGQHSIASRRDRLGVVFSPLDPQHLSRCAVLTAHELCHTFGASDKYEGEHSVFPAGFAEPERQPLHPQEKAEIMALGVPVAPGVERRVEWLGECAVGRETAVEMGWTPAALTPSR